MAGYFQADRSITQAFLPKHGTKFSQLEAYIFLTSFAAFAPREQSVGSKLISLNVGELVASERYLQSRWGWSRNKVRRFKQNLVDRSLLDQRTDQKETVLIVYYQRAMTTSDAKTIPVMEPKPDQQKTSGDTNIRRKKKGEEKTSSVTTQAIAWSTTDSWSGISNNDLKQWTEAYPVCDLKRQLASMNQWLLSNPSKAKKKQWRRFITNWLARQQERGGDGVNNTSATSAKQSGSVQIGGRKGFIHDASDFELVNQ